MVNFKQHTKHTQCENPDKCHAMSISGYIAVIKRQV